MNGVVIDTNVFVAAGFNSRRCRSTRTPSTMRCGSASERICPVQVTGFHNPPLRVTPR